MKTFIILSCITISGCAALKPVSIPIELEHVSHLTQHQPFNSEPTDFGFDTFSVGLKWVPVKNLSITLLEGINLDRHITWYKNDGGTIQYHGALMGPRETFQGRLTYEIPLR